MDAQTVINLGLVLLFVVVGGVFAATELALVSLRETQLVQLERGSRRGAHVARVARDPNRFLAAVQIGVTVAGFLSAAFGASTLAPDLEPILRGLGMGDASAPAALIGMTLVIAYLSLVFGELVPKRLALQQSVAISVIVGPVLDRFASVMRPVIWVLSGSTNLVVRLLGGNPHATSEQLSADELRELVSSHDELADDERAILGEVFAAASTSVKEAMRPRADVVFLEAAMSLTAAVAAVRERPYSRYPVTGESFDDILGFVHVRDLLGAVEAPGACLADVVRPALLVPSSLRVLPAVSRMREERIHLAVVIDEYGGTDGIVTLEDLLEELIGDIEDEYDEDAPAPALASPATLPGGATLAEFERATGFGLEDGPYDTVAGYLVARLGRIPAVGDAVTSDGVVLTVAGVAGRRLTAVRWSAAPVTDMPRRQAGTSCSPTKGA